MLHISSYSKAFLKLCIIFDHSFIFFLLFIYRQLIQNLICSSTYLLYNPSLGIINTYSKLMKIFNLIVSFSQAHEIKPEDIGLTITKADDETQPFMVAFLKSNNINGNNNVKVRTTRAIRKGRRIDYKSLMSEAARTSRRSEYFVLVPKIDHISFGFS